MLSDCYSSVSSGRPHRMDAHNEEGQMTNPKRKKWYGTPPEKCQVCGEPLRGLFVDGKTLAGPWARMCILCWHSQGGRIGTGLGQMYDLNTLECIAG